jgi:hypothetical protein
VLKLYLSHRSSHLTFRITRCKSFRKSLGGFACESANRLGGEPLELVDSRVASARGGGGGAAVDESLELHVDDALFGDKGTGCTLSISKLTFRRSKTGESANETDLVADGGAGGVIGD